MAPDKGVLRRYVPGLVLHTVPSYRRYGPLGKGVQALPGVMTRKALSDQDTGVTVLRQALAVLTGSQTALPRILDAEAMLLQAQEHLPAQCVRPMDVEDPDVLLGQCLPWLCQGGVIALQWQPLKTVGQPPPLLAGLWQLGVSGLGLFPSAARTRHRPQLFCCWMRPTLPHGGQATTYTCLQVGAAILSGNTGLPRQAQCGRLAVKKVASS